MGLNEVRPPIANPNEGSSRFKKFLDTYTSVVTKKPKVEGTECLVGIESTNVIFAISHLSDADPAIAAKVLMDLGRDFDIASLKTNQQDSMQSSVMKFFRFRHRMHDLENTYDVKKDKQHTSFYGQNFEDLAQVLKEGKDIIIAAHKAVQDWQLPNNAGVGDVYLAHLTGAPIIPVSIDIHSKDSHGLAKQIGKTARRFLLLRQPNVTVTLGTPIYLDQMPREELDDVGLFLARKFHELEPKKDEFDNNIERKDADQQLQKGPQHSQRYEKAKANYVLLREQAAMVMYEIAKRFPPEKRGRWGLGKAA